MLFKQIKYFMAIAATGSFSEAAAQCFISQSAVSQQITALERELDAELFERTPRGVILTEAGRYLYENAMVLLKQAEKLKAGVRQADCKYQDRFVVSFTAGCLPEELCCALARFKTRHREETLHVYEAGFEAALEALEKGQADIAVTAHTLPAGREFSAFKISSRPCYAKLSAFHMPVQPELVRAEDLQELPCIIVGSENERMAEEKFYRQWLGLTTYFIFAGNLQEAELMAAAGKGFLITDRETELPGLIAVPLYKGKKRLKQSCYLYTMNESNAYVKEFAALLQELCGMPQIGEVKEK